jgi:antitoxin PrlF
LPPVGTIDTFFHVLDGKVKLEKPLTIEAMNKIAADGWADELAGALDDE